MTDHYLPRRDLDAIRGLLDARQGVQQTHHTDCWRTHVDCAARRLADEIDRMRTDIVSTAIGNYDEVVHQALEAASQVRDSGRNGATS